MATKYTGFGADLQMGDGLGGYTSVASIGDIAGPSLSREEADMTSHDTVGGYAEFVPTLKVGGDVTFPCFFDPDEPSHDGATGLLSAFEAEPNDATLPWRIVFPGDIAHLDFDGFVNAFGWNFPVRGGLTADGGIRVTGAVALGAGAS